MRNLLILIVGIVAASSTTDAALKDAITNVAAPFQREIQKHIDTQKQFLGKLLNIDPDSQLSQLFPAIGQLTNLTKLKECYNPSIGDEEFNIFNNTIFDVIKTYYKVFPENFQLTKFGDKAKNLFQSTQEIGQYTVDCLLNPSEYQLGLTQLTDFSGSEYNSLLGAARNDLEDRLIVSNFRERPKPSNNESDDDDDNDGVSTGSGSSSSSDTTSGSSISRPTSKPRKPLGGIGIGLGRRKRQEVEVDPICFPKNTEPLPEKFDWRKMGKVTPARYQGSCGGCWAFASLAALESAYLIKGKTSNKNFDLSEQQLIACGRKDGCNGGTSVDAFNYILANNGVTDEGTMPFDAKKNNNCDKKKKKKRHARIKDYCLRGIYAKVDGKPEELTDQQIQYAIREYGPVYATLNADHIAVKHLKTGMYSNKKCSKQTNHAILVVGWDKKGWIIKNSWGKKWGDDGFFRMKRGSNMCGLNTYITFPIL
ncbi:hypothetical protein RDWZM_009041 [Blomia tropicalis]|uniref:Peptidase C1A papain C-terminal domain-containing protein n=1 Tax=Blomia tropicalis TaxID=40697 RepID=A0A9Q0RKM0_BLOTA|nr:hypothetical protein RDWZM_009041 [Blomia tropicalis]